MRSLREVFAIVATSALCAASLHSQTAARRLPSVQAEPTLQGEYAMEVETGERWLHERQLPRATPFAFRRSWLFVDSLRDSANGRRIFLTVGRSRFGRDSALIIMDPIGRVAHLDVGLAPYVRSGPVFPGDSASWVSIQRGLREGVFALPDTRAWDLASTFPRGAPRVGERWTDTLDRVASSGDFRQSMRGTRSSRITGDTVVDGRRLWMVRDSANVRYEERRFEEERTLAATVEVSRAASGIVTGVRLYDPTLRLFRVRDDTTRLAGSAVLRYPDGRSFRTPARYERTQRWRLYDSPGYATRLAALRASPERDFGGMVIVPGNDLQRRLASGDATVRDSIISEWQRTTDPDSATRLFRLYQMWVRNEPARAHFDSVRVASGDSAYRYELLSRRAFTTRRALTVEDVQLMLHFMDDPSAVWALNASRDVLYENLVQTMTTWPRAVNGSPYGRFPTCTVDACRLLETQWRSARETRLRDVGLVALVAGDPRRWTDTLLALDSARHPLLNPALLLAQGVGATWPAASKAPLPPPNSDWRVWREWMNGRDPSFAAVSPGGVPAARFEESHWTAIRFYEARTGRDVVAEIRRGYEASGSDSARLIFGAMLQHLGELHLTESQVAEAFASGEPARIELARAALFQGIHGAASAPVTGEAAAPLFDRLLASIVDSLPLWPARATDLRGDSGRSRPVVHAESPQIFLNGDSLPDLVRTKWQDRIHIISSADWNGRDVRVAGVFYTVTPPRAWGRFVQIELRDSGRTSRPQDRSPAQYAAAHTYYLMRVDGGWVIVAEARWVT